MDQTQQKTVNLSLNGLIQLPKARIVNFISELDNNVVNKSFEFDSESQNSLDREELLKMQIKQLKRENTFLKGKIQEFKNGKVHVKPQTQRRQSLNCINILKQNTLNTKNIFHQTSLQFILNQIKTILKSLAAVHKIQINDKVWTSQKNISQLNCKQDAQEIKIDKQFKLKINKKLQMIALQKQQTRFESLLEVFIQFYKQKMEQQREIKQKLQKYIEKTLQINNKLIQSANIKATQKSIKSSYIYSIKPPIDENQAHNLKNVKSSLFFPHLRLDHSLQKRQLSYSTIDGQTIQRQIN